MELNYDSMNTVKIKVAGVGGAGNNAVNRMVDDEVKGVELWAINTDFQALSTNRAPHQILLGEEITHGQGAGAIPAVGQQAAEASLASIKANFRDADIVFVAAGMGGGTGTGASPVIAKACKEMGILTVAIVTRPFTFEGKTRNQNAVEGLQKLKDCVDSLIVINNDQLISLGGNFGMDDALKMADDVLCHSVKIISQIILQESRINLDFADIATVMRDKGTALIGMGKGNGEDRARIAAEAAVYSPLLETSVKGAKNAIINVSYNDKMTLLDANEAVEIIREATANPDINIIFGITKDETLTDEMMVTVIATDFGGNETVEEVNEIANEEIEEFDINKIDELLEENKKEIEEEAKEENVEEEESKSFFANFLRRRKEK